MGPKAAEGGTRGPNCQPGHRGWHLQKWGWRGRLATYCLKKLQFLWPELVFPTPAAKSISLTQGSSAHHSWVGRRQQPKYFCGYGPKWSDSGWHSESVAELELEHWSPKGKASALVNAFSLHFAVWSPPGLSHGKVVLGTTKKKIKKKNLLITVKEENTKIHSAFFCNSSVLNSAPLQVSVSQWFYTDLLNQDRPEVRVRYESKYRISGLLLFIWTGWSISVF